MRVNIDADKCIASGACVIANPEVFAQDEDGIIVLLQKTPDEGQRVKVLAAAAACPALVIEVAG